MYPQPEQLGSRKNYLYFRIINKRRNQMTSSDQHASQVSRSFRGSGGYVNFVVALWTLPRINIRGLICKSLEFGDRQIIFSK